MAFVSEDNDLHGKLSDRSANDEYELFAAVLDSLNVDSLGALACKSRKTYQPDWDAMEGFQMIEIESPIFGSCHVLYPVNFHDGTRWIFKIPVNGTRDRFGDMDSRALRSEALTMTYIQDSTTIPIPTVFSFDDYCDNILNCPYILMEYIDGQPLYSVWYDKTKPPDVLHARRTRCLEDLAAAMIQLGNLDSDQGGSIMYGEQLEDSFVGPTRVPDYAEMLEQLHDETSDDMPIYVEVGPFSDTKKFYTSLLDRREEPEPGFEKGLRKLLRMLLRWIPEPEPTYRYPSFVLSHPDLNIQNVLVSEDGSLKGIIDWECVGTVPRSIGNKRYPSWLTRDWDPAMYKWNENTEGGVNTSDVCEDSPATLKFYRGIYAGFIEALSTSSGHLTRNSLICDNLFMAATYPPCTHAIVDKILGEIANVVQDGMLSSTDGSDDSSEDSMEVDTEDNWDAPDTFDLFEIVCALSEGKLSHHNMKLLKEGFLYLLSGQDVL